MKVKLNQLCIILMLIFCCLSIKAAIALDFNGSTVISSDVNDGLNAIGSTPGDTLFIDSRVNVSNPVFSGVDLNNFPFEVTNNGNIMGGTFGIVFDNGSVINSGTITGGFRGVQSFNSGIVTNSGTINGRSTAIQLRNEGAVFNTGMINGTIELFNVNGRIVTNSGTITGSSFSGGINLFGDGAITNSGTITGADGINIGSGTVTNSGMIKGEIRGIDLFNGGEINNSGTITGVSTGVMLGQGGKITNSGDIVSENTAIFVDGGGTVINNGLINGGELGVFFASDGEGNIMNTGTITGGSVGIQLFNKGEINNSGTIIGNSNGVFLQGGGEVINTGTITADLVGIRFSDFSISADIFTNNGTIIGSGGTSISMGRGSDTVILQTGAIVIGDINGGSDDDITILQGSATFHDNFQNFENLTMEGTNWQQF